MLPCRILSRVFSRLKKACHEHSILICHRTSKKKIYIISTPGAVFTTRHFLRNLRRRSNRLECYITLSWTGLPMINSLNFLACSFVTKKMKFCEHEPMVPSYETFYGCNLRMFVIFLPWQAFPVRPEPLKCSF